MTLGISNLVQIYPVISNISPYLSTLDLYHLALANSELYQVLLSDKRTFANLTKNSICLNRGQPLLHKQYRKPIIYCDLLAWPCDRCPINICSVCEFRHSYDIDRNSADPHYSPGSYELEHVICYCSSCDSVLDPIIRDEWCFCDRRTMHICKPCSRRQGRREAGYNNSRTSIYEPHPNQKALHDHQHTRVVSHVRSLA